MKKVCRTLVISLVCMIIFMISSETVNSTGKEDVVIDYEEITSEVSTYEYETEKTEISVLMLDPHEAAPETEILSEEQQVTDEEIWLIAWITMGEAEGECEEGKRLVIDTILNRVDHSSFPDTIYDVIYQPSQFSCVWNGRLDQTTVTEEVCQLVREELVNRCNYEVLYFAAGGYRKWGERLFQVGNHYFCGE